MEITSLSFLYLLLPVTLVVFLLAPRRTKPGVLLFLSLLFFLFTQPATLPLMLLSVFMDYVALQVMRRFGSRPGIRRACVCFSVVKNILILLLVQSLYQMRRLYPALGVSVYTLSGMDCVLSAYREEIPCESNIIRFFLYCCFFPRLYAGPLLPYGDFVHQLQDLRSTPRQLLDGAGKLLPGLVKILLFGRYLSTMADSLRLYGADEITALSTWLMVLCVALSVYYQFSGYCDVAQGVGLMVGLHLPLSFYYPYQSQGIEDFFLRFHSTVSAFLRRTIYRFLQEDRNGPTADALNLLVMGVLLGLWFGLRLNCLLWGLFLALFGVLERYPLQEFLHRIPTLFLRLYTFFIVLLSFAIFSGETVLQGMGYWRTMAGIGADWYNYRVMYLLSANWQLLLISCFFATNACNLLATALRRALPRASEFIFAGLNICFLALATALLV